MRNVDIRSTIWALGYLVAAGAGSLGCLSEQSFTMQANERRQLAAAHPDPKALDTRKWLRHAHDQLHDLLPAGTAPLLTDDLESPSGRVVDVYEHFGIRPEGIRTVMGNMQGIRYTAQGASAEFHIDTPPPAWPGFEDVWVPMTMHTDQALELAGRLGFAQHDGQVIDADCIVILPGFFGDNGVQRTRDLSVYLRDAGFHVLALEIRGCGQTEHRYPDVMHTFGVLETDDLMQVADWLEARPQVRRTGLVGFCWGANIALLAAWYESRAADDSAISPGIDQVQTTRPDRSRYAAGIIAFSPVVRWENLMDELDTPRSYLGDPVYHGIQRSVRTRMERKNHPDPSGSLRQLIAAEYEVQGVRLPRGVEEGYDFLRLMPYQGKPYHNKLEYVRMPVLLVHAADDPLTSAQDSVDLLADVDNPRVAGLILGSGGHVGFAAWAKQYYFSMISNFFDPHSGAAAAPARLAATEP